MFQVFVPVILAAVIVLTGLIPGETVHAAAADSNESPVIVCIDPGHGGENLGAEWDGYTEKEMTLKVAEAMKDRLEKYDGIEVYLTRDCDKDISLEERIDYAKEVGADFFFCLHFNMSENHESYGSECWISAFGEDYARGMDFAKIEMEGLTDLGLYERGIKTRLNSKGSNYYGVLRIGDDREIPAIIIEHCYLDNAMDYDYYDDDAWLTRYGETDAEAVARYYGLTSVYLESDYSGYTFDRTEVPDECMAPDTTDPDNLSFSIDDTTIGKDDDGNDQAYLKLSITASDPDCCINYYSYSVNGGLTWSERLPWKWADQTGDNTITASVPVPFDKNLNVRVMVFNMYDLTAESDLIKLDPITSPESENTGTAGVNEGTENSGITDADEYTTVSRTDGSETDASADGKTDYLYLGMVAGLAVTILVILIIGACLLREHSRRRRRRRKP